MADAQAPTGPRLTGSRRPGPAHEIHVDAVPQHAWASLTELDVSVTGRSDRQYVLTFTGRAQGLVRHWTQGPYDIFDETVDIPVTLPTELELAVVQGSRGHLTARVVPTTLDGRAFPSETIGRTPLVFEAGRVVGVARDRWDEAQGLELADDVVRGAP